MPRGWDRVRHLSRLEPGASGRGASQGRGRAEGPAPVAPRACICVSTIAFQHAADLGVDPPRRAHLTSKVQLEVERRLRGVRQYIDPSPTPPFALAVFPDSAYDVCRGSFVNAHSRHVMVV